MPKKYIFKNPSTNQVKFECNINSARNGRNCVQCMATRGAKYQLANIPGQPRCRRNTCLNSLYCFQHLITICNLRIFRSNHLESMGIDGLGLYAYNRNKERTGEPIFKTNEIIGSGLTNDVSLYGGEILTKEQLDARYDYIDKDNRACVTTAPYAIKPDGTNIFLDAACKRGPLAYANDRRVLRGMNRVERNSMITPDGRLKALTNIFHNTEILIVYSSNYWNPPDCEPRKGTRMQPTRSARTRVKTNVK